MSNLLASDTGVDGTTCRHSPRIKIVVGDQITSENLNQAASVTISDTPKIIGKLPSKISKNAVMFVKMNTVVLLKYWKNEIPTREMLNSITKIK